MKIIASMQAASNRTTITVDSEDSITINGEATDLSPIPDNGQADGVSPLTGMITKDDLGEVSLTVLMQYIPSLGEWNGEDLQEIQVSLFPVDLTIADFIIPPEPTP